MPLELSSVSCILWRTSAVLHALIGRFFVKCNGCFESAVQLVLEAGCRDDPQLLQRLKRSEAVASHLGSQTRNTATRNTTTLPIEYDLWCVGVAAVLEKTRMIEAWTKRQMFFGCDVTSEDPQSVQDRCEDQLVKGLNGSMCLAEDGCASPTGDGFAFWIAAANEFILSHSAVAFVADIQPMETSVHFRSSAFHTLSFALAMSEATLHAKKFRCHIENVHGNMPSDVIQAPCSSGLLMKHRNILNDETRAQRIQSELIREKEMLERSRIVLSPFHTREKASRMIREDFVRRCYRERAETTAQREREHCSPVIHQRAPTPKPPTAHATTSESVESLTHTLGHKFESQQAASTLLDSAHIFHGVLAQSADLLSLMLSRMSGVTSNVNHTTKRAESELPALRPTSTVRLDPRDVVRRSPFLQHRFGGHPLYTH